MQVLVFLAVVVAPAILVALLPHVGNTAGPVIFFALIGTGIVAAIIAIIQIIRGVW